MVLAAEAVIVEDGVAGGGINPGNANSSPRSFTDVNGTVYFSATDAANGTELWRINGSGVAELVEDAVPGGGIYPGSSGSYPTDLMNVNGTLYFRAAEDNSFGSVEYDPHGYELWRINGSGVAEMVEDDVPGGGINNNYFVDTTGMLTVAFGSDPRELTNVNGTLYFGANGYELWRINGSGVAELVVGLSYLRELTNVNGTLYFQANDGGRINGYELWRINGSGVAEMVEDAVPGGGINPGRASSDPDSLTNVNGTLYFVATDGINGYELWRINGSGVAELVEDAVPGGGINPGRDRKSVV